MYCVRAFFLSDHVPMSADAAFFDSDLVCPGHGMKEGGEQKVGFAQAVDDEGASVICTGGKDGTDTYIVGDTIVTCGTVNPEGSVGNSFYLEASTFVVTVAACRGWACLDRR